MAAFGSVDNPFNEAFGRIIEVHWKTEDTLPCDGTSSISGRWGTLEDNTFVQETTPAVITGSPRAGHWQMEFNGFFAGAINDTVACYVDYVISTTATLAGTTDTEENTYSGTLAPGQSIIVGIVRSGWQDIYAADFPSFDHVVLYGFGEYRLLEVTQFTESYDP
jgi:hypothetical protein